MVDRAVHVDAGLYDDCADRAVIIAGDFNAWALEWGSRFTNQRAEILLETLAILDIDLAYVDTVNRGQIDLRVEIDQTVFR